MGIDKKTLEIDVFKGKKTISIDYYVLDSFKKRTDRK